MSLTGSSSESSTSSVSSTSGTFFALDADFLLGVGIGTCFFGAITCFEEFDATGGFSLPVALRPCLRYVRFGIIDGVVVETRLVDEDDRFGGFGKTPMRFFFKVLISTVLWRGQTGKFHEQESRAPRSVLCVT